jgi:hypothetical protein
MSACASERDCQSWQICALNLDEVAVSGHWFHKGINGNRSIPNIDADPTRSCCRTPSKIWMVTAAFAVGSTMQLISVESIQV